MGPRTWKPSEDMYRDEKRSTQPPPPYCLQNVATPRKTLGTQTPPLEDDNALKSRDIGRKIIEDEYRRMCSCDFGGQNRMPTQGLEAVKAEPVVTDPATEGLDDDDEDNIWLAESVSFRFGPTPVPRGGGDIRSTSPVDASWVVVDHSSNPVTRSQSPALSEYQQSPKTALQDVPKLWQLQTPACVEVRSLDSKSLSSNATRFAVASSPGGLPNPITRAHQVQRPSSPHVGNGGSPCGMDRRPGGQYALPPVKHSRQMLWTRALQGEGVHDAQNDVANSSDFVEGPNLREASGGWPDTVANYSEASSWYQVSHEEAQHVVSSSLNLRCAANRMAMRPAATREPQLPSFPLTGSITPHQPPYSSKRNTEPDSRLAYSTFTTRSKE